ncbi:SEC-C domain-containing protein [Nocardiopsis nanhaiensis]
MVYNSLSPQHPVDASGSALAVSCTRLGLPDHVLSELKRYPESAGEILLEEAGAHSATGNTELAVPILDALMEHAPDVDDRQYAAAEKLKILLEGDGPEARTGIERLVSDLTAPRVIQDGPANMVAEVLAEHGCLEQALNCYNAAARTYLRGSAEDLGQVELMLAFPLIGRANVRAELGYAPDEFDRAVRDRDDPEKVLQGLAGPPGPGPHQPVHNRARQVLCSRKDFALASERGLISGEHVDEGADAYFRAGERTLREYAVERPDLCWETVLFSVEEMEEFARSRGGDASDRQLRGAWAESLPHDDKRPQPWPPERNKPCWCASGRKYKKCCGSPSLH